jgi:hypothetical protein
MQFKCRTIQTTGSLRLVGQIAAAAADIAAAAALQCYLAALNVVLLTVPSASCNDNL